MTNTITTKENNFFHLIKKILKVKNKLRPVTKGISISTTLQRKKYISVLIPNFFAKKTLFFQNQSF